MGVLVTWALPVSESSWTHAKVERSASESGVYAEIASQSSSDNTYYDESGGSNHWYKVRFYNSSSSAYSGYSDPISASALVVYYCKAPDVARLLQVDEFGGEGSTQPSIDDVEEWILEAQDDIDSRTQHAWRTKTVTDELHDIDSLLYERGVGWPIYLPHSDITTLASGTDKIEIWDGSSWVDWIASADYTEGRDEDYWMDYKQGILYIRSLGANTSFRKRGLRLTYRYGTTTVPKDIRKCCAMMVAIDVLMSNDRTMTVPEDERPQLSFRPKIARWEKKISEIISNHAEVLFQYGGN